MNSNEDMQGLAVSQSEPHLRDYLRIIYVRRWTLISVFLVVTLTTLVWLWGQVPIYRATCVVLMQPTQQRVVNVQEVYDPTMGAGTGRTPRREFLDTHAQLIKGRAIAEKTFLALEFDKLPELQGRRDPVEAFRGLYSMKAIGNTYL
ncbi:MAG: hypothetical protein FJ279_23190, partial [Planctomycetes bacterium]|nr:hypothetical protein [Planctomycetota bacterium]